MARFDFAKLAAAAESAESSATFLVRSTAQSLAGPKTMRGALALCVFAAALTSGLVFLVIQNSHNAQLDELAEISDRASQTFRDRFAGLNADVLELVRRVGEASAQVTSEPQATAETQEVGSVATSGEDASPKVVASIEVRWRQRLEASRHRLTRCPIAGQGIVIF